jgi:cobalt-zinc-cadmium efflux system protein
VLVRPDADCHAARLDLAALLRERFGIDHTTLQVDHSAGGALLDIQAAPGGASVRGAVSPPESDHGSGPPEP